MTTNGSEPAENYDEPRKKLLKKPSAVNIEDYVNITENDDKTMEILLALTKKSENENDPSWKHDGTDVDTFDDQLEEDKRDEIFFNNSINSTIQARDRKMKTTYNGKRKWSKRAIER